MDIPKLYIMLYITIKNKKKVTNRKVFRENHYEIPLSGVEGRGRNSNFQSILLYLLCN